MATVRCAYRAMLSRIWSAVLVQTKGFGSSLCAPMYSRVLADRGLQLFDASENTPSDAFVGEFGEPALHQVDPRTVGRGEVDVKAGCLTVLGI